MLTVSSISGAMRSASMGTPSGSGPESPSVVPGAMPTRSATPTSRADGPVSLLPLGPTHTSTGTDEPAICSSRAL